MDNFASKSSEEIWKEFFVCSEQSLQIRVEIAQKYVKNIENAFQIAISICIDRKLNFNCLNDLANQLIESRKTLIILQDELENSKFTS